MNYYLDCEFIEDFHKPFFGKKRHFIDLISIGVVSEDNRNYYAISNEYRYKDASVWVKENVIKPMYIDTVHGDSRNRYNTSNFQKHFGLDNEQIKSDLLKFFGCYRDVAFWRAPEGIKVYGYYSSYDLVLFCSLFGRMIDLPKGFPMYCIDLMQMLYHKLANYSHADAMQSGLKQAVGLEILRTPQQYRLEWVKKYCPGYPKQKNEHNALADARWNKALHEFIIKL